MAVNNRIRNSQVTLQFMESPAPGAPAVQLGGSLTVNTDWKMSSVGELSSTELTGETEDALDQTHRGWEFSGTFQELDPTIDEMYERRVFAYQNGTPLPELQIIVTRSYTDGITPPAVRLLHGDLVMKLDSTEGSGKDFVKNMISGKCKLRTPMSV